MTDRRPWPNTSLQARDDSAQDLRDGIVAIEPIVTGAVPVPAPALMAALKAENRMLKALQRLTEHGARVRL